MQGVSAAAHHLDAYGGAFGITRICASRRKLSSWTQQLGSGGVLALEEVERILTDDQLFHDYLDIAGSALRARGTELYIGPALAEMTPPPGTEMSSAVRSMQPTSQDAAKMFALNLETLRQDDSIKASYSEHELGVIAEALNARIKDRDGPPIVWEIRQAIVARTAS